MWMATILMSGPATGAAPLCDDLARAPERSVTIEVLSLRYSRIHPEFEWESLDPKSRKMLTRALLAIDLRNGGAEILPKAVEQLRNLLRNFESNPPYRILAMAYAANTARGEIGEAKREASVLLDALSRTQRETALEQFGIHSPDDPFWETLRARQPAQFEKITVQDLDGKEHKMLVLLGHPEGGSSAIERFHRAIRSRYGTDLYINDDLVPSALGFYQGVPDGGSLKDSFIIIRSDYFTQDFLDFVGFHEGRHAMFKRIRTDSGAVEAVEVRIEADPGKKLPSWMPSPEGGVYLDRYSGFMTFEENYNHAKDLKYALRVRHQVVLDAFLEKKEIPARLLFDLGLVSDKLKLLREVTHRTKTTALDTRLFFEKSVAALQNPELRSSGKLGFLARLAPGSYALDPGLGYSLTISFSTPQDRALAAKVIEKRDLLANAYARNDPALIGKRWKELEPLLGAFQSNISRRLIQSYDFGLSVRISLGKLETLFREIGNTENMNLERYLEFRKALFDAGRDAYEWLFKGKR